MTVRVGIIGVGVMGADHARIVARETAGAKLQALADADGQRVKALASELGAETAITDPLAIINDPNVDAVIIASPDQTHQALTLACIAARKPVLCEKPLAPTQAECLAVVAAETALSRRLVQVGYMRRFDPGYADMKAACQSGDMGKALMLHCIHRNVSAPDWFTAGMAITNSAVHEIDIARWLLDAELTSVTVMKPPASPSAPVFLIFETSAGQIVDVEMFNNAVYGYDVRGELVCEKGTVSLRSPVTIETNSVLAQRLGHPADWRPRFAAAYRIQMRTWINAIQTGTDFVGASAWDGYAAGAVADAGLEALAKTHRSSVKLVDKPALYP